MTWNTSRTIQYAADQGHRPLDRCIVRIRTFGKAKKNPPQPTRRLEQHIAIKPSTCGPDVTRIATEPHCIVSGCKAGLAAALKAMHETRAICLIVQHARTVVNRTHTAVRTRKLLKWLSPRCRGGYEMHHTLHDSAHT